MEESLVHRIAYWSTAADGAATPEGLAAILDVSRRNNARDGITGLLLAHEGNFFQVVEGPRDEMADCFARICHDPRHRGLLTLRTAEEPERAFPEWRMGFAAPDDLPTEGREAVMDLLTLSRQWAAADPRVQRLIDTFLDSFRTIRAEGAAALRDARHAAGALSQTTRRAGRSA